MNLLERTTEQMELTLDAATRARRPSRQAPAPPRFQPRRHAVSRWWFAQMRGAVQSAHEWPVSEGAGLIPETHQVDLALSPRPTRFQRSRMPTLAA